MGLSVLRLQHGAVALTLSWVFAVAALPATVNHELSVVLVPSFEVIEDGPEAMEREKKAARTAAIEALAASSVLLSSSDGEDDTECDVALQLVDRMDAIDIWDTDDSAGSACSFPPREIGGTGALKCALDHNAHLVKLVAEITYCETEGVRDPPQAFGGCSRIGSPTMAVVWTSLLGRPLGESAVVWPHEFSHTRGNCDRHPPYEPQEMLMNRLMNARNRSVSHDECQKLKMASQAAIRAAMTKCPENAEN